MNEDNINDLKYLGGLSDDRRAWEFDMFDVWYIGDRLYWGADSGCSCPSPYEGFTSLADYCTGTKEECLAAIKTWVNGDPYYASEAMYLKQKIKDF